MLANLDFKILYDTYSERLFGMVLRGLNGDLNASQKVLEDIFVRIVEEIKHTNAGEGTLLGWMMTITRQQIRKYEEGQLSLMHWTFEREYRRAAGFSIALQFLVARSLSSPEADYLSVIELVYDKGYNVKQVADMMNIPHDTVRRLLHEGLNSIEKPIIKDQDPSV